jgi:hypothetical protein
MGQRVAFATRQSNFATNFQKFNYSGFSGFPFAFFTKEEAEELYGETDFLGQSGTLFPFEFTLNELVEFWWRIKKLDFGSITIPTDGYIPEFTISGTIDSYENEIQLAKEISKDFFKDFEDAFSTPDEPEIPQPATVILANEYINCIFHENKYFPYFLFTISIFSVGFPIISNANEEWHPSGDPLNTIAGTLTYKGKSTNLYTYSDWPMSLDINLTPSEYYAYAATDGSPIYNTTTGARLQDPRN